MGVVCEIDKWDGGRCSGNLETYHWPGESGTGGGGTLPGVAQFCSYHKPIYLWKLRCTNTLAYSVLRPGDIICMFMSIYLLYTST